MYMADSSTVIQLPKYYVHAKCTDYRMRSNYLQTKLSWLEDFIKCVFIFMDAGSHEVYIAYIHYICNIIYVLKLWQNPTLKRQNIASSRQARA